MARALHVTQVSQWCLGSGPGSRCWIKRLRWAISPQGP